VLVQFVVFVFMYVFRKVYMSLVVSFSYVFLRSYVRYLLLRSLFLYVVISLYRS